MALNIKCEQCGADLAYEPGTTGLTCGHCSHHMSIESGQSNVEAHVELDLEEYLDHFDDHNTLQERHLISCQGCGAETELEENKESGSCPFCETPLVVSQTKSKKVIQPKSLLPFSITKKVARENFKDWLNRLWFAPNDLKKQVTKHDKFKGVYLPFWTYDCDTFSQYTGQRGTHYYVTVTSTDKNGNTVSRQEQRTHWTFVSGQVQCAFDDVLVPATRSLPTKKLYELEPWDLHQLVDYKEEYLSGYITESYQINLKEGYTEAKNIMETKIHQRIRQDIGGDAQQISSVNTHYSSATFKHILLPTWISAYRYKKKLYQILVNARTGEVQGERPYSWLKIASAVVTVLSLIGGGIYLADKYGLFNQ